MATPQSLGAGGLALAWAPKRNDDYRHHTRALAHKHKQTTMRTDVRPLSMVAVARRARRGVEWGGGDELGRRLSQQSRKALLHTNQLVAIV